MQSKNPFAINFGIIPLQYIERESVMEAIIGELESETMQNSCFMLSGIRGSGKTVTMTSIEKRLKQENDWIVINLSPEKDMLQSLTAKLHDTNEHIKKFMKVSMNLSKFGIGIGVETERPVADIESALEIMLKEIQKSHKKLLVTVDEVRNTKFMREFASSYQLMIRQEYPFYLIMAGLYENIHNLQNDDNLTFLYRTPRYEMTPLNITLIKQQYKELFSVSEDEAYEMAALTGGYPFAYQALGKYLWEEKGHHISEQALAKYDTALAEYVYDKIWSELSATDKYYLGFMAGRNSIETQELLELSGKKKNEFSQYRARLKNKEIIDVSQHGMIRLKLPRFSEYIKARKLME